MHFRKSARKRIVKVHFDGPTPLPGSEVMMGDINIGHIGSVAGSEGLAMLRLDRVEDAEAAGTRLTAGVPRHSMSHRRSRNDTRSISTVRRQEPLPLARHRPALSRLSRRRMGRAGIRRPRSVREIHSRRLSGGPLLDHHPAPARELSAKPSIISSRTKIARYKPAKLAGLMQDEGIIRNRAKIEAAVTSAQAYLALQEQRGLRPLSVEFRRRRADPEQVSPPDPDPGRDAALGQNLEGFETARL